jgi:glutathione S-transferase
MTILLYELAGRDAVRPFSPHCWKTVMSLAHKGLDFERRSVPFTKVSEIEGGASKTVPVIRDGDTVLADSFAIAVHLDGTYPDRPSLFGGPGGVATARFIERWSQLTIHSYVGAAALLDIHALLAPADQAYFRDSREKRFGKALEAVPVDREQKLASFRAALEPLRSTLSYQPFIGGDTPLFVYYIVFGDWFERCLDLHGGVGRRVAAAT